jgi:hypothetical protein
MRPLLRNAKGQSIVEITLITPLILVALYVPFDFGVSIFTGHLVQIATRDGARRAATTDEMDNSKAETLATAIHGNLPEFLASKQVTVNYYAAGAAECAQYVEVIAQGTYNFFWYRFVALLGFTPPDPAVIARTTRVRYEYQPDRYGGQSGSTTTFCSGAATASFTYPAS